MTATQKQLIKELNKQLIGLSCEEAVESLKKTNHLLYICVTSIDGVGQTCAINYSMNRLNVVVKEGKIDKVQDFG